VLTNPAEGEVFAPVALFLEAIDLVLQRLKEQGAQFGKVQGISGAGMQHGTVFWSRDAESRLANLDGAKTLVEQLKEAFSHPHSPNWQDASTQKQCEGFDRALGSETKLAEATGSSAHHVSWQCVQEGCVLTTGVAIQWTTDSKIPGEIS
jgi:xylulokinase